MGLVTDQMYASMLGPYLRNFKKKNNTYNFSCHFCGDSKKSKSKARAYLYQNKGRLSFKCHNCDQPASLYDVIMAVDSNLAHEYLADSLMERDNDQPQPQPQSTPPVFNLGIDGSLEKISSLDPSHYASKYVRDRLLPEDKLYFTDHFKQFANKVAPDTFSDTKHDEARLIIPLLDRKSKVMGYQGRSFRHDSPIKYITILVDPQAIKVYGLDTVDLNKTIRAFEGPLDAMFIPNSVATTGGRQDTLLEQAGISKDRTTLVYDNEPRNIDTINKIDKAINNGWTVCIWPPEITQSDVNDMIKAGYTAEQLTEIIDGRSFKGLMASMELSSWRKV